MLTEQTKVFEHTLYIDIPEKFTFKEDPTLEDITMADKFRFISRIKQSAEQQINFYRRTLDSLDNKLVRQLQEATLCQDEFAEVIINCVDSAIKKNKEHKEKQDSVEIKISLAIKNQTPIIKIKDNGSGHPDLEQGEKKEYIPDFSATEKTSNKRSSSYAKYYIGGTGVGLSTFAYNAANRTEGLSLKMKNRQQTSGMTLEIHSLQKIEEDG